ncbi:MAG TPA: hypothetical protein PLK99_13075, partial [Burkholderiales bacterium]|nr:hypothetical protein [Burkholderiales bacterium]
IQSLAQRFRTDAKDEATARDLAMDLRAIALSIQTYQQSSTQMLQQLGQYIQILEQQMQTHPQPMMQSMGWNGFGGGGFMGNLVSGLGLGAGIGIAEDIVGDIFNSF